MKTLTLIGCLLISFCFCDELNVEDPHVVEDPKLSDEEHVEEEDEEHNKQYDHEAFFGGKEEAKEFEELSPEESQKKLGEIFVRIDKNGDGFVTVKEMEDWIHYTRNKHILKYIQNTMIELDLNKDGNIGWDEFKTAPTKDEYMRKLKTMLPRMERRFKKADFDNNKLLNTEQFAAFIHPADHDYMKELVIEETIEDADKNKDGFISLQEYYGDLYPQGGSGAQVEDAKKKFKDIRDKNGDGRMDKAEIANWILHPDDHDHANNEAKHLVKQSDTDKDGKISKKEMLGKYDLFVSTNFGDTLRKDHSEL